MAGLLLVTLLPLAAAWYYRSGFLSRRAIMVSQVVIFFNDSELSG
jgi:hypothetical protein